MLDTATKIFTLEEYLALDLEPDKTFVLDNGVVTQLPPESPLNLKMAMYLLSEIIKVVPYERITQKTEIVTLGSRAKTRVPDLMVLSELCLMALEASGKSVIMLDMPPPILVVGENIGFVRYEAA